MRINVSFRLLKSKQKLCTNTARCQMWFVGEAKGRQQLLMSKSILSNITAVNNQENWPLFACNCLLVNLVNLAEMYQTRCNDTGQGLGSRSALLQHISAVCLQRAAYQPLALKVSSPDGVSDLNVDLSMVCHVCAGCLSQLPWLNLHLGGQNRRSAREKVATIKLILNVMFALLVPLTPFTRCCSVRIWTLWSFALGCCSVWKDFTWHKHQKSSYQFLLSNSIILKAHSD